MPVRQYLHLSSISSTWEPYSASFQPFWCHPHVLTQKSNPCFRWTNIHSQFGVFSHPSSIKLLRIVFPISNPANGWPYKFRSRGTTGSSKFPHDFGHLCRGRRIQISGHSDFGILSNLGASYNFTWVYADTASAACPSQPGNLAITSIIFCSSHLGRRRALFSEDCVGSRVVLYNVSPLSTTLPLYFIAIWVLTPHFFYVSSVWQNGLSFWLLSLSPNPMLDLSRASSIPCPRQLLHPEFSSLVASE